MAPQGFVMIHGKTDLKPFRKLLYCESYCNWVSNQNEINVRSAPRPPLDALQSTSGWSTHRGSH
jgi:hypothetical protein